MSAVWTLQREARIITDPQESAAGISGHHLTRAIFDPDERDDVGVNPSREPAIADLIAARMSRRAVLKGMAAAGFCGLFGGTVPARVGAAPTADPLFASRKSAARSTTPRMWRPDMACRC